MNCGFQGSFAGLFLESTVDHVFINERLPFEEKIDLESAGLTIDGPQFPLQKFSQRLQKLFPCGLARKNIATRQNDSCQKDENDDNDPDHFILPCANGYRTCRISRRPVWAPGRGY